MLKEIGITINNEVLLQQGIFVGQKLKKGKTATLAHGTYVIQRMFRLIQNSKDEDSSSESEDKESEDESEDKGNTESTTNKFWKQKKQKKKESTEIYQADIAMSFDLDNQSPIFIGSNKKPKKVDSSRTKHGFLNQQLQTAPGSLLTVRTSRIINTKFAFKNLQFMEEFGRQVKEP